MTSTNYRVMVFDLGNVLLPFDYQKIIASLNNIDSGLGDKFKEKYYSNYQYHSLLEKNEISVEHFTNKMLSWLDYKISALEFHKIYSDMFTVNEKMTDLLPKLKEKYKLVLLSNTNYIHQKNGWEKHDFIKLFDKLILSHEVGAAKPEAKIYKAVEKFTGEPAETHCFTDDIPEYVQAAKLIGWDGHVFTTYENFLQQLIGKKVI